MSVNDAIPAIEQDILYISGSLPRDSRITRAWQRIKANRHALIAEVKRLGEMMKHSDGLHERLVLAQTDLKRKDEALKQIAYEADNAKIRTVAQNALKSSEVQG